MDPEKFKELFPNINRSTFNLEEIYNRPLSPSKLNKQTYLEIFQSRKQAFKKQLNYMNYSNQNYNVISNDSIDPNAYNDYLEKRIDYDQ